MFSGIHCLISLRMQSACVCLHVSVCTLKGEGGFPVRSQIRLLPFLWLIPVSLTLSKARLLRFGRIHDWLLDPQHFFRIKHSLLQHCGYFQCRNAGLRERLTIRAEEPLSLPHCSVTVRVGWGRKTFLSWELSPSSSPDMSCGNTTWIAAYSQELASGNKLRPKIHLDMYWRALTLQQGGLTASVFILIQVECQNISQEDSSITALAGKLYKTR